MASRKCMTASCSFFSSRSSVPFSRSPSTLRGLIEQAYESGKYRYPDHQYPIPHLGYTFKNVFRSLEKENEGDQQRIVDEW